MGNDLEVRRSETAAAGLLMIVSGALTVGASLTIVAVWGWWCVGLLWLVPAAVGVGEVVVGASVIGNRPQPSVRSLSTAGLVSALVSGNLIGVALEIAAQILLARNEGRSG